MKLFLLAASSMFLLDCSDSGGKPGQDKGLVDAPAKDAPAPDAHGLEGGAVTDRSTVKGRTGGLACPSTAADAGPG